MKDLKAIRGTDLLHRMVAEGEHEQQDFKFAVSDASKIARSLSAFANCRGGRLLIGVKDNGTIAGVRNEEDIYVVELAAERYCRPSVEVSFKAYRDGTAHVIVASVDTTDSRPIYAIEPDGRAKAYYRVADENIAAHPLMVRAWELAAGSDSLVFRPDGPLPAVLNALSRMGEVADVMVLARALHITRASAEDAIATLAALGLADFRFDGTAFRIIAAKN
ncbi:MAG: putative DNA binding domain-containing protein [Muribaculaceae bacterium]|nr:putative DNA binding domain-containing protein [Muribaculaceae bacterium]